MIESNPLAAARDHQIQSRQRGRHEQNCPRIASPCSCEERLERGEGGLAVPGGESGLAEVADAAADR